MYTSIQSITHTSPLLLAVQENSLSDSTAVSDSVVHSKSLSTVGAAGRRQHCVAQSLVTTGASVCIPDNKQQKFSTSKRKLAFLYQFLLILCQLELQPQWQFH